jgi:hypothetical protein
MRGSEWVAKGKFICLLFTSLPVKRAARQAGPERRRLAGVRIIVRSHDRDEAEMTAIGRIIPT